LQYLCLHLNNASGDAVFSKMKREIRPIAATGWT